jgi:hypothetical protein
MLPLPLVAAPCLVVPRFPVFAFFVLVEVDEVDDDVSLFVVPPAFRSLVPVLVCAFAPAARHSPATAITDIQSFFMIDSLVTG